MTDETLVKVMQYISVREVWLELHRLFNQINEDKIYDLCLELFNYTKSESNDMSGHILKLSNIWAAINKELNVSMECCFYYWFVKYW